jgi:hypothetical protein
VDWAWTTQRADVWAWPARSASHPDCCILLKWRDEILKFN